MKSATFPGAGLDRFPVNFERRFIDSEFGVVRLCCKKKSTINQGAAMGFLDALVRGATAFLKPAYEGVKIVVRDLLKEIDSSEIGKAVTSFVSSAANRMRSRAKELAEEEAELAAKWQRDRRQSEYDAQRQAEIQRERERMRAEMEAENARKSAEELREKLDELQMHQVDDDTISESVGIMAHKICPACGGMMRIRQGGQNQKTGRTRFWWQCSLNPAHCPTITLDPLKEDLKVVRGNNTDLDVPREKRHAAWNSPPILQTTHGRLRGHLGDDDEQLTCPKHLLPMKLMPLLNAGGRLLDSYAYICMGVESDGRACSHQIKVEKMPQVAATLKRTEGKGIL